MYFSDLFIFILRQRERERENLPLQMIVTDRAGPGWRQELHLGLPLGAGAPAIGPSSALAGHISRQLDHKWTQNRCAFGMLESHTGGVFTCYTTMLDPNHFILMYADPQLIHKKTEA